MRNAPFFLFVAVVVIGPIRAWAGGGTTIDRSLPDSYRFDSSRTGADRAADFNRWGEEKIRFVDRISSQLTEASSIEDKAAVLTLVDALRHEVFDLGSDPKGGLDVDTLVGVSSKLGDREDALLEKWGDPRRRVDAGKVRSVMERILAEKSLSPNAYNWAIDPLSRERMREHLRGIAAPGYIRDSYDSWYERAAKPGPGYVGYEESIERIPDAKPSPKLPTATAGAGGSAYDYYGIRDRILEDEPLRRRLFDTRLHEWKPLDKAALLKRFHAIPIEKLDVDALIGRALGAADPGKESVPSKSSLLRDPLSRAMWVDSYASAVDWIENGVDWMRMKLGLKSKRRLPDHSKRWVFDLDTGMEFSKGDFSTVLSHEVGHGESLVGSKEIFRAFKDTWWSPEPARWRLPAAWVSIAAAALSYFALGGFAAWRFILPFLDTISPNAAAGAFAITAVVTTGLMVYATRIIPEIERTREGLRRLRRLIALAAGTLFAGAFVGTAIFWIPAASSFLGHSGVFNSSVAAIAFAIAEASTVAGLWLTRSGVTPRGIGWRKWLLVGTALYISTTVPFVATWFGVPAFFSASLPKFGALVLLGLIGGLGSASAIAAIASTNLLRRETQYIGLPINPTAQRRFQKASALWIAVAAAFGLFVALTFPELIATDAFLVLIYTHGTIGLGTITASLSAWTALLAGILFIGPATPVSNALHSAWMRLRMRFAPPAPLLRHEKILKAE